MKIVVFAPDLPFPPNRGGKADIWRRVMAFRALGHDVMLVNLQEKAGALAPTDSDLAHVDAVVSRRYSFNITRSWLITIRQLACIWFVPWHVATRVPTDDETLALEAEFVQFKPDFIWLDGPWFGIVGLMLAAKHGIPILYRSHNIEHKYIYGQAAVAVKRRDRIAWSLASVGLKRFELRTMRRARTVFDISVDDLAYWQSMGIKHMHWLPPLPELAFATKPEPAIPGDIVFLGNLGTPNNVRGVAWLVKEVMPRVRAQVPAVRCRIVGSNPTPFVQRLLAADPAVELCADVERPTPYLFGARVLVNPIMTGSGVQVKMLDMLMTDAPIVTCSQGARGLPAGFKSLFRIADDADNFAKAICEEMRKSSVDVIARQNAREAFAIASVGKALELAAQT